LDSHCQHTLPALERSPPQFKENPSPQGGREVWALGLLGLFAKSLKLICGLSCFWVLKQLGYFVQGSSLRVFMLGCGSGFVLRLLGFPGSEVCSCTTELKSEAFLGVEMARRRTGTTTRAARGRNDLTEYNE